MSRFSTGQIFLFLLIAIGVSSLIVGMYALNEWSYETTIVRNGERTDATLVQLTSHDGCTMDTTMTYTACEKQTRVCDVIYRYGVPQAPLQQAVFTQRALVRLQFCTHQITDTVQVIYLRDHPSESRIVSEGANVERPLVRAFVAAGCCGACLLLLLVYGSVVTIREFTQAV